MTFFLLYELQGRYPGEFLKQSNEVVGILNSRKTSRFVNLYGGGEKQVLGIGNPFVV
jgi:hypothetical protein